MATSSRPLYNPSDINVAPTVLPEHAVGFIDLRTLSDIHRYLNESEVDTDIELAMWVEKHYLYNPIGPNEEGRVIRTAEGFAQLDRAYRRVRNLTGKAQDKWPFFDRSWKTMSSVMVRNNSRGESAPGISLPSKDCEARDSPMSKSLDAGDDEIVQMSTLQVPFGKRKPGRPSTKSPHAHSAETTPPSLPQQIQIQSQKQSAATYINFQQAQSQAATSKGAPKNTDLVSGSGHQAKTQRKSMDKDLIAVLENDARTSSPTYSAQSFSVEDAGRGKIRGPNGRYLPKKELSHGKSCGSSVASRVRSAKNATPSKAENSISSVQANEDLTGNDIATSKLLAQTPTAFDPLSSRAGSKQTASVYSSDMNSNRSTPPYTLAAEADPVASNLDRLPPGFRKNKRKSQPASQQGPNKRIRAEQNERGASAMQSDPGNQGVIMEVSKRQPSNRAAPRGPRSRQEAVRDESTNVLADEGEDGDENEEDDKGSMADYDDVARGLNAIKPTQSALDRVAAPQAVERRAALGDLAPTYPPPALVNDLLTLGLSKTTARAMRPQPKQSVVQQPTEVSPATSRTSTSTSSSEASSRPSTRRFPAAANNNVISRKSGSPDTSFDPCNATIDQGPSSLRFTDENTRLVIDFEATLGDHGTSNITSDLGGNTSSTDASLNTPGNILTSTSLANGVSENVVNGAPSGAPLSESTSSNATNGTHSAPLTVDTTSNNTANEAPSNPRGTVEFIARIHNPKGIVEIPLTEKHLTSETDIIKRYAEWYKNEFEMEVSFEQFSKIFGFAKRG